MARIRDLELLFELKQKTIQSKADCLVAAIHCMLVNKNLQCVGTGEEFDATHDSALGSEILPDRWNENQEEYTLRYTSRQTKNRCLMKAVLSGNILKVNIIVNQHNTYEISLDVNQFVTDDFRDYKTAYTNLEELSKLFNAEIVEKIHKDYPVVRIDDTVEVIPRHSGPSNPVELDDIDPPQFPNLDPKDRRPTGYPKIGNKDLDPTGRGQGTMHFDPSKYDPKSSQPSQEDPNKPLNVPPGARYDPIGPITEPGKRKPDPDHYKPPKGEDDDGLI